MATTKFGIVTAGTSYGIAQSVERDDTLETETVANQYGNTIDYQNYDKK